MLFTHLKKKIQSVSRLRCCRPPGGLSTGKTLKFLICRARSKFIKQYMRIFKCYLHIKRKNYHQPPGSGAAGLQVASGQVKNQNFLFEELEVSLENNISVFLNVIYTFEEVITIGLQVQVLHASRWPLDR